jgi:hypothetical protein
MKTIDMKKHKRFTLSILHAFILVLFVCVNTESYAQLPDVNEGLEAENQFPIRGFHIDLRIQVMTPEALNSFATELAGFGINTIVMEWEATFPYEKHATISNKYAYTREEVKSFINHCSNLGIEVIPLQQCFGHVEYILRHDRYNHLKESRTDISQVCPSMEEDNKILFTEIFEDMASLHTSKYFHIGGDETRLLGHCSVCSERAKDEGKSKLFADYLTMICNTVVGLGKVPVLWADIVLKYPEVVDQLPKETVYVDWNYGWKINHFGDIGKLLEKGLSFWGAPAIRSHPDNWYTIDWQKHFNNQRDFIPYARKAGYNGMIMTSWSTSGVYGFTWDTNYEVVDMHAIRNVYPLSGFRILLAAYAQSLEQTEPLNPETFVVQYAQDRFGLTTTDGNNLWKILTASPQSVNLNNLAGMAELDSTMQSVNEAGELLVSLTPKANVKEFEHLRLMHDLRVFYLAIKKVESIYESDTYNSEMKKELLSELSRLLAVSKGLNERFTNLNKGFLYPEEIEEQNVIRNEKLKNIYAAIANVH